MGSADKVRAVRDETHDSVLGAFADLPFGKAEEADVQVVEEMLSNAEPGKQVTLADLFPVRIPLDSFVVVDQISLFVQRYAGKTVIGWVAEDDDDLPFTLHALRSVVLLLHLREVQLELNHAVPAREGIGEEHRGPMSVAGRGAQV